MIHVVRYIHPHDNRYYVTDEYKDGVWVRSKLERREPHQKYWNSEPEFCIEGCKLSYKHIGCCFR